MYIYIYSVLEVGSLDFSSFVLQNFHPTSIGGSKRCAKPLMT